MRNAEATRCRVEWLRARWGRWILAAWAAIAVGADGAPPNSEGPAPPRTGGHLEGRGGRSVGSMVALAGAGEGAEDEFTTGVLATYRGRDGATVLRVEPTIAAAWTDGSPDEGLQLPVRADWSARLIVKQPGTYRFAAYLDGSVVVQLGAQVVLEGSRDGGWLTGEPVRLGFGDRPLEVRFEQRGPAARLQVFWASEHFPLEPLPSHQLYVEDVPTEATLREEGRRLFEGLGCAGCHTPQIPRFERPGPDLRSVGPDDREALITQLIRCSRDGATATSGVRSMPRFGFSTRDISDIVAYLIRQGKPRPLLSPTASVKSGAMKKGRTPQDVPVPDGRQLVLTAGCLACHSVSVGGRRVGRAGPLSAGDLAERSSVRSVQWLFTWLKDPQRLRSEHRMPEFPLTDAECWAVARALKQWPAAKAAAQLEATGTGDAERGRSLVRRYRCGACHRFNDPPPLDAAVAPPKAAWERGCAVVVQSVAERSQHQPRYVLTQRQTAALRSYWQSLRERPYRLSSFERGRRLLAARGCLRCHPRDAGAGLADVVRGIVAAEPDLTNVAAAMMPPRLNAVGDKLRDGALREAIARQRDPRRLPWLLPRMPRFRHRKADVDALLSYLIGHDRIPDDHPNELGELAGTNGAGSPPRQPSAERPAGEQLLVVGQALLGSGGFSCIACHQVGDYVPRNTALGTRGSDLLGLGARMRRSFFMRWTRSPLRVAPGVEMPSYTRPVPGVLDGTIETQLAVLWDALNDPQFRAPPHPAAVEQLVTVPSGAPPEIIRDVFALPEWEQGKAVARAFAVGFGNGHGVLFDLDEVCVRQWSFGDFAQQRTVGKSWYWDLAGVPIARGWPVRPDWGLIRPPSGRRGTSPHPAGRDAGGDDVFWLEPARLHGTRARLMEYATVGKRVHLRYAVDIPTDDGERRLEAEEIWAVHDGASETGGVWSGWSREVTVRGLTADDRLAVRVPHPQEPGAARFRVIGEGGRAWTAGKGGHAAEWRRWVGADGSGETRRFRIEYLSTLQRPQTLPKLPEPARETAERLVTTPGFVSVRLPLPSAIMPTALAWTDAGELAFTSLKGGVWVARDADGDGLEDSLKAFERGLAAPYGLLPDGPGRLLVAHKPEVLRLIDEDGDGRAERREVVASGWGYTDDYHDWTTGLVRDRAGNLYVGTGSDYAQKGRRPADYQRWRGKVLQITPRGEVVPVGHGFRYPIGLAIDARGRIFVSDNQGVQNCFNEINWLQPGGFYGVPALADRPDLEALPPAIQVPHPWTRSVNGLFFLPQDFAISAFAGHGIGCEYNGRFLVRFTYHEVAGQLQGAVYAFTEPGDREPTFQGPLCGGVSPQGVIHVGNIHDSGWLGGRNVGSIVRMVPDPDSVPNGIREIRAEPRGFRIAFIRPVDRSKLADASRYVVIGYTRVWRGGYATPDSGRHRLPVRRVDVNADGTEVLLECGPLRAGHVYEISCGALADGERFFPAVGHYTMNRVP